MALCLAGAVPAGALDAGIRFPERIAGFERGQRTDYEARAPGLGYSVAYTNGPWDADVYVYDNGRSDIPDGLSPVGDAELAQAAGDISAMVARGRYAAAVRKSRFSGPKDRPRLTCEVYAITAPEGGRLASFLCLTGLSGKFVKFRITGAEAQASPRDAVVFLMTWLEQHPAP